MTCPYLEYRRSDDEHEFDHERPYCGVAESFVSPMRADICNDRHAFDHTSDCELFPDERPAEFEERSDGEASTDGETRTDSEVGAEGETDAEGPIRADPSE